MLCKICGNQSKKMFSSLILNKYEVDYFHCNHCEFIQTEEPHWLEEAYSSSINMTDTGILARNKIMATKLTSVIFNHFDIHGKFLDYAGGYGLLTREMRDRGFNYYWQDKYTSNLVARGFEYSDKIKPIELITSFESFEHFYDPISEINDILSISRSILFSTELYSMPVPHPEKWWYYGREHGQHISLYSIKTLRFIASEYGLNLLSNGSGIHLLTEKNITNKEFLKSIKKTSRAVKKISKVLPTRTLLDMNYLIDKANK